MLLINLKSKKYLFFDKYRSVYIKLLLLMILNFSSIQSKRYFLLKY